MLTRESEVDAKSTTEQKGKSINEVDKTRGGKRRGKVFYFLLSSSSRHTFSMIVGKKRIYLMDMSNFVYMAML
jgi:hypothetical protein